MDTSNSDGNTIANSNDILNQFAAEVERIGLVKRGNEAKLLYLSLSSRVLPRPVSVVVKGESSAGKSFLVDTTLKFFPGSAYIWWTETSATVPLYTKRSFEHRILVFSEASGMGSRVEYLVRSLLSEGRIRYEVTESRDGEWTTREIERKGPTGLILTTTRVKVHAENETRLISLYLANEPEILEAAVIAVATTDRTEPDLSAWLDFQEWFFNEAEHRVVVPFIETLARMIPRRGVARLVRDVATLRSLIETHALLHQKSRGRDESGAVVATLDDYDAVRELYGPLMAEGLLAAVPKEVRETVEVVKVLKGDRGYCTRVQLMDQLGITKGPLSRRIDHAKELGYLRDYPSLDGTKPVQLGDPMPDDTDILPTVEQLEEAMRGK